VFSENIIVGNKIDLKLRTKIINIYSTSRSSQSTVYYVSLYSVGNIFRNSLALLLLYVNEFGCILLENITKPISILGALRILLQGITRYLYDRQDLLEIT